MTALFAVVLAVASSPASTAGPNAPSGLDAKDLLNTAVAVTQVAAQIAVVVTLIVAIFTLRAQRKTWAASTLWDFQRHWESERMHRDRGRTARNILKERRSGKKILFRAYLRVLAFFEALGFLVRTKAIEGEEAWVFFSDIALAYWLACEPRIKPERDRDETMFAEFAFLRETFIKINNQQGVEPVGPEVVESLLNDEVRLAPSGLWGRLRAWLLPDEGD